MKTTEMVANQVCIDWLEQYNDYRAEYCEDTIYDMADFNDIMGDQLSMSELAEIVLGCCYGIDMNADYFTFDGYGELATHGDGDIEDMMMDDENFHRWMLENYEELIEDEGDGEESEEDWG